LLLVGAILKETKKFVFIGVNQHQCTTAAACISLGAAVFVFNDNAADILCVLITAEDN